MLPFKSQVIKATDKNGDGSLSVIEIKTLLTNIGAGEKITEKEIDDILTEVGVTGSVRTIPNEKVFNILMNRVYQLIPYIQTDKKDMK